MWNAIWRGFLSSLLTQFSLCVRLFRHIKDCNNRKIRFYICLICLVYWLFNSLISKKTPNLAWNNKEFSESKILLHHFEGLFFLTREYHLQKMRNDVFVVVIYERGKLRTNCFRAFRSGRERADAKGVVQRTVVQMRIIVGVRACTQGETISLAISLSEQLLKRLWLAGSVLGPVSPSFDRGERVNGKFSY